MAANTLMRTASVQCDPFTTVERAPALQEAKTRARTREVFAQWLPLGVFALSLTYALVRYVLFKGVAVAHVPLYITNKALALSGAGLIGLVGIAGPLARYCGVESSPLRRRLGACAGLVIGLHIAISALILRPSYFSKHFSAIDGMLTAGAELALLAGVIGALATVALSAPGWRSGFGGALGQVRFWSATVMGATAAHVTFLGFPGWLTPDSWPGHLPPITLVAFVVLAIFGLRRVYASKDDGSTLPS